MSKSTARNDDRTAGTGTGSSDTVATSEPTIPTNGRPAARVGDVTAQGDAIVTGEPTVLINGMPAAGMGDVTTRGDVITTGEPTVLIGGRPAARLGDVTAQGGVIITGGATVLIGSSSQKQTTDQPPLDITIQSRSSSEPATDNAPLNDPDVQQGMREAWTDSQASDPANRHEEGGYIVRESDGTYGLERWPRGRGASITVPPRDSSGRYNGKEVIGNFHTHPNPPIDENGASWTQGSHAGDWNVIANQNHPGNSYIISRDSIWVVSPSGQPNQGESGNEIPLGSRQDLIGN